MEIKTRRMGVNYGLNKVRFTAPVPIPSNLRLRVILAAIEEIKGGVQAIYNLSFEVEGKDKPSCIAEYISRIYAKYIAQELWRSVYGGRRLESIISGVKMSQFPPPLFAKGPYVIQRLIIASLSI